MAFQGLLEMHDEPSIDADKLSYEIFSILETKFLFGYDDSKQWIPTQVPVPPPTAVEPKPDDLLLGSQTESSSPLSVSEGEERPKIRILSIDGGGCSILRGVLPCRALAHLERVIREKSNDPNATIADYFDVVIGTGMGGIVALMLFATRDGARAVFEAEETWRLLAEQGRWIFNAGGGGFLRRLFNRPESGSGLEKFLKETFGGGDRALTLRDTLKPVLIPCYDLSTAAPFLFSRADAVESDGYNFCLWDVCRATSAVPGLLEPVSIRSVDGKSQCVGLDGGLVMSNPTAAAITHVLHNRKEFPDVRGVEDLLVLSLGTGQVTEVGGGGLQYENVKGWKAKDWLRPVVGITADGSADFVDQAVGTAFGQWRSENYVRIQANGSIIEADSSHHNAKKLTQMAEQMLKQKNVESVLFGGKNISELTNLEKLDLFAAGLVLEHDRRRSRKTSATSLCS
ncbi:patatin-like protein 6 [Punica granatum]|uniref:Patatin-like protein 6 n=2 Tax=Punica granatum TaxID=22663 RepID=A0A6P8BVV1_PUNGR|nr:patatin-like protein 6 [Punica granatum]XP_031374485.1 patatin-like protein 6 [Punica granatum]OWM87589.1 hypothetical protein CDL15_Pgr022701 [Punica granatum]PKI74600.1 hypothetical protein CRG98_004927 [Punica granatum]